MAGNPKTTLYVGSCAFSSCPPPATLATLLTADAHNHGRCKAAKSLVQASDCSPSSWHGGRERRGCPHSRSSGSVRISWAASGGSVPPAVFLCAVAGGLEESVNESILHEAFVPFGDIKDINTPLDQVHRSTSPSQSTASHSPWPLASDVGMNMQGLLLSLRGSESRSDWAAAGWVRRT